MKILLLILFGVALSEQYFWFEKSPESNEEKPTPFTTGTQDHRYILNIMKYKIVNGTDTQPEFSCLGILIAADYALTPADCVKLADPYKVAVQFVINDEVGPSIILKHTEVIIHDNYTATPNEANNIAIVKFYPQGISVDPPIFEHFYPIARGALPHLNYCSVYGRLTHLSNPPEEKVLVNGPGCCLLNQNYCTVFPDANHSSCNSRHGAPVLCNNAFAGFLIKKSDGCENNSGRILLKYHSVNDFKDWINYYVEGPQTTTTKKPNSAASISFSMSLMTFLIILVAIK